MILSDYHLGNLGKGVQIAGRATGGKKYVEKFKIICTQTVYDKVTSFNKMLLEICSINPENFNKTDFINSQNTIPVKLTITDESFMKDLFIILEKKGKNYKSKLHRMIKIGKETNKITMDDRNNIKKFNIDERNLNTVRIYKDGDNKEARRFKSFENAFDTYNLISQSGDDTLYNIDFALDDYIVPEDNYINRKNVAWITFKY